MPTTLPSDPSHAATPAVAGGGPSPVVLTDDGIRALHRSLYAAFSRSPDNAGILQGVRKLRGGRPHVRVVLAPSPKNGGWFIPCEGRPESAMAECLEVHPDVSRFRSQPLFVPGLFGRDYVPDFVAEHPDGTFTLIDVKIAGRLIEPAIVERMQSMRSTLKQAGLRHALVTELELQAEPHAQIRRSLRMGAELVLDAQHRNQLLTHLRERPMPVSDFRRHATAQQIDARAIEKLALLGDIVFPINHNWSEFALLEAIHGTHSSHSAGRGTIRDVGIRI